ITEEGDYTLSLEFCDVYGNRAEKSLHFKIRKNARLEVRSAVVFPNPFRDNLTCRITHNRTGHDLEVEFRLFSRTGQLLHTHRETHYNAGETFESKLVPLNISYQIKPELQIYLYEVTLRSLQDATTGRITGKLIHQ